MANLKKKKKELSISEQIINLLEKGYSADEMRFHLIDKNLLEDDDDFEEYFLKAIEELSERLKKKPPEIIYAEYYCDMMRINKQIDLYLDHIDKTKIKEASFALKAKIDLYKDLHITAREKLGLLNNVNNNQNTFIGNINVGIIQNMTNEEKKQEMMKFAKDFLKLTSHVDKQKGQSILDVETGPVHYGPSIHDMVNKEEDKKQE